MIGTPLSDKKNFSEGGAESALVTTLGDVYYLNIGSEIPILYSPAETTPISLFSLIKITILVKCINHLLCQN